jgi:hypothetical protein
VYAPVCNDAVDAVGSDITLQALVERESAIIKKKKQTNWKDADLKSLFFSLLLPYCRSGEVAWRKYFSPGYKVAPGRNPAFPTSVMIAIAQVGSDFILSFILSELNFA